MTGVAGFAGVLVITGLILLVSGLHRDTTPRLAHPPRVRLDGEAVERALAAVGAFVVVLVVTRWPVAAIGTATAGWFAPPIVRRTARRTSEDRTEAIALWAEMLRDAVGTSRGIEGVLVATAPTAPLPIRAEVQAMATRLESTSLDDALVELGVALAHPIGDLVVTALRLTASAGTREVRGVLADLAAAAYAEADSERRIEVARERPRAAMRYSAMVIAAFVAGLAVFSGEYLAPYRSLVGQLVLVVVGVYWALGFWWMHRMGRVAPVERFLAASPASTAGSVAEVPR